MTTEHFQGSTPSSLQTPSALIPGVQHWTQLPSGKIVQWGWGDRHREAVGKCTSPYPQTAVGDRNCCVQVDKEKQNGREKWSVYQMCVFTISGSHHGNGCAESSWLNGIHISNKPSHSPHLGWQNYEEMPSLLVRWKTPQQKYRRLECKHCWCSCSDDYRITVRLEGTKQRSFQLKAND